MMEDLDAVLKLLEASIRGKNVDKDNLLHLTRRTYEWALSLRSEQDCKYMII